MFNILKRLYDRVIEAHKEWSSEPFHLNERIEKIIVSRKQLLWRRRNFRYSYYNYLRDKEAREYEISLKKWKAEQIENRYEIIQRLHGYAILDHNSGEIVNIKPNNYDGYRRFNFAKRATAQDFLYSLKSNYAKMLNEQYQI